MGILLPAVYNQQDSRWAAVLLGFNTQPNFNFYNYACLISCQAMAAKYYGKNVSPVDINNLLKELKPTPGFADGGNYVWGSLPKIYSDIQEKRVVTPSALTDPQIGEIKTALEQGFPVMLHLDYNPKTVENDMHFVLAIGYNPNDENDFTIADPIGGKVHSLKDYLGWYKPSARNTIEQYVIYKGPVPSVNAGCLIPNNDQWRKTYEGLVHGSGEWDKTVAEYLGSDKDPKVSSFENVRSVISGIKSRVTDLGKQLDDTKVKLESATVEIDNQKDKVANVIADCQRQLALKEAEIDSLNGSSQAIQKMKAQYEGTILQLQKELAECQKAGGQKDVQIVELNQQLKNAKNGASNTMVSVDKNLLQQLVAFLQAFLKK